MSEILAILTSVANGVWRFAHPGPLTVVQRQVVEGALSQIKRDAQNIELQLSNALPKFASEGHRKAVMEDSWKCLRFQIDPVKHVPGFHFRVARVIAAIDKRNALKTVLQLRKLRDKIEKALIAR